MSNKGYRKNKDGQWVLDAIDHLPDAKQTRPIPMALEKYEVTSTLGALGRRQGAYLTLTFRLAIPDGDFTTQGIMSLN